MLSRIWPDFRALHNASQSALRSARKDAGLLPASGNLLAAAPDRAVDAVVISCRAFEEDFRQGIVLNTLTPFQDEYCLIYSQLSCPPREVGHS